MLISFIKQHSKSWKQFSTTSIKLNDFQILTHSHARKIIWKMRKNIKLFSFICWCNRKMSKGLRLVFFPDSTFTNWVFLAKFFLIFFTNVHPSTVIQVYHPSQACLWKSDVFFEHDHVKILKEIIQILSWEISFQGRNFLLMW